MKLLKKHARGALCLLLSVSILGGTLLYAFGTAADDYEETLEKAVKKHLKIYGCDTACIGMLQ